MRKELRREGFTMTDILTMDNIKDFIGETTTKEKNNSKLYYILLFLSIKFENKNKMINKYIVKDKNIRNGKATIKGTRITTDDMLCIISEANSEKDLLKYIFEQYPSIENKEQIIAALKYSMKKVNTFKFIWMTLTQKV